MRPVTILLAAPLLLAVTGTPPAFAQESGGKAGVEDAGPTAGGSARAEPADLLALSGDELIETVNGAEFTGPLKPLAPEDKAPGEDASAEAEDDAPKDKRNRPDPFIVKLQVLLDRAHASPGVIDGFDGSNVRKAIWAFQAMNGMEPSGDLDEETWRALDAASPDPVLTKVKLERDDVKGPFTADLPTDYGEMAELKRLGYRNAAEKLAERFHVDLDFLHQLNPKASFEAGSEIIVPQLGEPAKDEVVRIVADKKRKQLLGYGEGDKLVVAYPATIGSSDMPSPSGTHKISAIARNPVYSYRPDVNFKQGDNDKPLKIPPGPNNPVGSVWIDLTEPTYGIHGTPDPSKIDKTNSHGCVRLTNWSALDLAGRVKKGVPVEFVE
jgi:lipoprotein-anchoring transpeptidase ErfK/SrfK